MENFIEKEGKRNKQYFFLSIMLVAFTILVLVVGITQSALFSSKTATGVISIVLPPSSGIGDGHLYYDAESTQMYLGSSTDGFVLASGTNKTVKVVLVDTQSASSAYIKIELSVLGVNNALSYNTSGQTPMLSDSTTLNSSVTNGQITMTSSGAVAQYSYLFLDSVLANVKCNTSLINATLQIKATVSLSSDFANSSTSAVYYNISTIGIVLPTGEGYVATAITQAPEVGQAYKFSVTLSSAYNKTAPTVKVNGTTLSATSGSNGVYNYTISSLQGGESITIEPVINTYTITITPTGTSPNSTVITKTLTHGSYIVLSSSSPNLYYKTSASGSQSTLYTGSSGNYTVTSYSYGGSTMGDGSIEVTSDMSISAYWEKSGSSGGTGSPTID